jgi:hypothetical protein
LRAKCALISPLSLPPLVKTTQRDARGGLLAVNLVLYASVLHSRCPFQEKQQGITLISTLCGGKLQVWRKVGDMDN